MAIKQAIISAGGFGTRLRPTTDTMPKPMIPILGKPMAAMLVNADATVMVAHSRSHDLPGLVGRADIVIGAVGKPELLKTAWIREGAVVVDAAGHRAFVASGGADVVTVVDLDRLAAWVQKASAAERQEAIYDLSLSAEYVVGRIPTRRNPRQLVLSPDGATLLVAEHLEDSILVVDANKLVPLGRILLGDGGTDDPIRRGERMFTTAAYTFQHQFSCRSCHPDGHVDGLS